MFDSTPPRHATQGIDCARAGKRERGKTGENGGGGGGGGVEGYKNDHRLRPTPYMTARHVLGDSPSLHRLLAPPFVPRQPPLRSRTANYRLTSAQAHGSAIYLTETRLTAGAEKESTGVSLPAILSVVLSDPE